MQRKTPAGGRGLKGFGSGKGLKHWVTNATGTIVDEYLDLYQSNFTAFEVIVLRFVKSRTLRWGKEAERIPFRHFTDGVVTDDGARICSGLPMSPSTIRKALYSLIDKGWIIRRAAERHDGGDDAHEYGLNMDRFKEIDNIEEVEDRAIKSAAAIQASGITLVEYLNLAPRTAKAHAIAVDKQIATLLNYRSVSELEPEMHLKLPKNPRATRVCVAERGDYATHRPNNRYSVSVVEKEEKKADAFSSTAARPRARVNRQIEIDCKTESALQTVERVTARSRTQRAERAGSAKVSTLSKAQLQAILDRLILDEQVDIPRTLVTDKSYGLMKKRAKEHQVEDLRGFLSFVVMHWADLAHRYNFGLRQARKAGTTVHADDMLPNPDAWTIALKFSWFARHYSAYKVGAYEDLGKKIADEKVSALQREVDRLDRSNKHLRQERNRMFGIAQRTAQEVAKTRRAGRSILGEDTRFQTDDEE